MAAVRRSCLCAVVEVRVKPPAFSPAVRSRDVAMVAAESSPLVARGASRMKLNSPGSTPCSVSTGLLAVCFESDRADAEMWSVVTESPHTRDNGRPSTAVIPCRVGL